MPLSLLISGFEPTGVRFLERTRTASAAPEPVPKTCPRGVLRLDTGLVWYPDP